VWYALQLTQHRDASLYLDTRNLRAWAKAHLRGKRVLNTFAYTGSLGVAARAAPSGQVITTDANQTVLAIAAASFALNGFTVSPREFRAGDFFAVVSRLSASSNSSTACSSTRRSSLKATEGWSICRPAWGA
jgi:23S rRNA (cytosine1962-C5)-methyltransferase